VKKSYFFIVLAPPTLNTLTATRAIQPIIIIKENAYIVKDFLITNNKTHRYYN